MLEANMAPQGRGIDGSGVVAGPRTNSIRDAVYKPSVDANLVQDVMGSSPKTGGLSFQESMTRGPLSDMAARPVSGTTDLYGEAITPPGGNAYARTPAPGLQNQAVQPMETASAIGNPNNLQGQMRPFDSLTSPTAQTSLIDKAKGLYQEYMPEALGGSRGAVPLEVTQKARAAYLKELADTGSKDLANKAYDAIIKAGTPGMLSTYGPAAALALGATALAGGFKTEPATMPLGKQETGFDYLSRYPERYKLEFGGISGARNPYNPYMSAPRGMAEGGIAALEMGGTTYPRKTGHINGPGTGTSDSIPALLSDGEFVFTAKAVRAMGQGSRRKGAKKLYSMMKMLEKRQG